MSDSSSGPILIWGFPRPHFCDSLGPGRVELWPEQMGSNPTSLVKGRERPADLPDFKRPPLIEVVLGVQFSELRAYRTQHTGLLWGSRFRADFPICKERRAIDAAFETFGSGAPRQPGLQLEIGPGPAVPRMWFIKEDDSELVQVQADRFLHNWRRAKEHAEYPRYEKIRGRFFSELSGVQSFFEEEGIGAIEPNQCEVTYVNHIELDDGSDPGWQLVRIFNFLSSLDAGESKGTSPLPKFEEGGFALNYVFNDPEDDEPRVRVHVEAQPAITGEGLRVCRLALTARGSPAAPSFQGVADTLDLGRDAVVRTFTNITTSEMHERWERIQ